MRIALVVHGFPPHERTGVENYSAGLAQALAGEGHVVEVFAPRRAPELPEHSLRRERRGAFAITWLTLNGDPDGPRGMLERPDVARSFGVFLDAERPEVVHLQHVVKLGLGPIFEANRRGIPIVYTAHDYYAICHRYTLLRPDLSHCDVRGDALACGLCDAALGYLNGIEGLGDYQMGVLPDQLGPEQARGLAGLLADDPEPAGWHQGALDAAADLRRELDSLRLQAFARVDLILAPTRFLADELARGGIPRERIEVLPYGIESADLEGLPPVVGGSSPRFAFFGGLSKHKGVHVLLDAFAAVRDRAELTLWGYSSDQPYVARLRERARAVGAVWGGPYERRDLPALLAEVDVVVVPSLWVENQPLVIREAFAGGRPVITSRLGALPESVRDGIDGLLFEPGDATALARAMQRCIEEDGLVARLAEGIAAVHTATDQARELVPRYARIVRDNEAPESAELPSSVAPFAARLRELQALPTRTLFERALQGLARLRTALGDELPALVPEELLAQALSGDPDARVFLRDGRSEAAWREEAMSALETATAKEREWLNATLAARQEEVDWLRCELAEREEELVWLRGRRDELERDLGELEELERLLGQESPALDAVGERFTHLLNHLAELREGSRLGAGLAYHALETQALLVQRELQPLTTGLHAVFEVPAGGPITDPAEALLAQVRLAGSAGQAMIRELVWRREAMKAARAKAERGLMRLLLGRTGLGQDIRLWEQRRARDLDGEELR